MSKKRSTQSRHTTNTDQTTDSNSLSAHCGAHLKLWSDQFLFRNQMRLFGEGHRRLRRARRKHADWLRREREDLHQDAAFKNISCPSRQSYIEAIKAIRRAAQTSY